MKKKRPKISIFSMVAAVFLLVGSLSEAKEMHRSMDEMNGDCQNYKMDLKNDFKIWQEASSSFSMNEDRLLNLDKKMILKLKPQASISFLKVPEKKFPTKSEAQGGQFRFVTDSSGKYRVSAGEKLWFDVLDAKTSQILEATQFEMQTGCSSIFKTVEFELKAKTTYVLQVSSSNSREVQFLISKLRDQKK